MPFEIPLAGKYLLTFIASVLSFEVLPDMLIVQFTFGNDNVQKEHCCLAECFES